MKLADLKSDQQIDSGDDGNSGGNGGDESGKIGGFDFASVSLPDSPMDHPSSMSDACPQPVRRGYLGSSPIDRAASS